MYSIPAFTVAFLVFVLALLATQNGADSIIHALLTSPH